MAGYNRGKANLGKTLQKLIDMTNRLYENRGIADIQQTYPEVTVLRKSGKTITQGYYKEKGMPDYVGVYNGRAILFDAKETKVTTSFGLALVKPHQYKRLESWHKKGACTFLVVAFTGRDYETYVLPFPLLKTYWEAAERGGRKSIPYDEFVGRCARVDQDTAYYIHYLKPIMEKEQQKGRERHAQ